MRRIPPSPQTRVDRHHADDTVLLSPLAIAEYNALRTESADAKKNQQSILQWSIAGIGILFAGSSTALAGHPSASARSLASDLLGLGVPLLCFGASLIWLGEIYRMQRAGAYLREIEMRAARSGENESKPAIDFAHWPIGWETVLATRSAGYRKDALGALGGLVILLGAMWGAIALSGAASSPACLVGFAPRPTGACWSTASPLTGGALTLIIAIVVLRLVGLERHRVPFSTSLPTTFGRTPVVLPAKNEEAALSWLLPRAHVSRSTWHSMRERADGRSASTR